MSALVVGTLVEHRGTPGSVGLVVALRPCVHPRTSPSGYPDALVRYAAPASLAGQTHRAGHASLVPVPHAPHRGTLLAAADLPAPAHPQLWDVADLVRRAARLGEPPMSAEDARYACGMCGEADPHGCSCHGAPIGPSVAGRVAALAAAVDEWGITPDPESTKGLDVSHVLDGGAVCGAWLAVVAHGDTRTGYVEDDEAGAREISTRYVEDDLYAESPVALVELDTGRVLTPDWARLPWA